METLEIQPKDFLVKWVHAPDNCTISWQVKPVKKSVNLAIYRKKDEEIEEPPSSMEEVGGNLTPPTPPGGRFRSSSVSSVNKVEATNFKTKSRSSTFSENLNKSDLTLVQNHNKLIGQELVQGSFVVDKGGMFAFIFDNSFSKTTGKKVLFSSTVGAPPPRGDVEGEAETETGETAAPSGELFQGVMLKRRRKKLQGFTKRFFVLNFKNGTLSYFRQDNSTLRGQMPVRHSIVSANPKNREFIIDSGMEVWDLKALTAEDFNQWVEAFNLIKREPQEELKDAPTDWDTGTCESVVRDLRSILHAARAGESVVKDLTELLARLSDTVSVTSNEFYDAQEYADISSGVVILGKDDESEESTEEEEESESSSEEESEETNYRVEEEEKKRARSADIDSIIAEGDEDAETLWPLPHPPVKRTEDIPEWTLPVPSILGTLRKNVGKDLSQVTMPVDTNEPLTVLQRFAEMFEYADMVDKALKSHEAERLLRIAAFAVTFLSAARVKERSNRKPFNPLLGETFEMVREDLGVRFVAEKVNHRPPVFAMFAESEHWELGFSPSPDQKFWGKSMELITRGTAKLTVKGTGEVFTWEHPNTMLKNIIAGEKYSEPSMAMTVKSSGGCRAVVEFAKGGMFSGRSEDLTIKAYNGKREMPASVRGKWTESLTLDLDGTQKSIWVAGDLVPNSSKKFGLTRFAVGLNSITDIERGWLPPTDSRLRPDLQAYLRADVPRAEKLKLELEEQQRVRRKQMEEEGRAHEPVFFRNIDGEWEFVRGDRSYWARRRERKWEGLTELWPTEN